MLAKLYSGAVIGIEAHPVEIEVNQTPSGSNGMREGTIAIVGLPDTAVKESRDRVFSALTSSGYQPPRGVVLVNLAPADLRKEGSGFDLAIALGLLGAIGIVDPAKLSEYGALGELALDGSLRPVRGALPIADKLNRARMLKGLLVPPQNAREAALAAAGELPVFPVSTLAEAVAFMQNNSIIPFEAQLEEFQSTGAAQPDFGEVKGQHLARRALEISAAGGHNLLLVGPPGTGKSMLAARLGGILPPMTLAETLETSRIHSVLGLLSGEMPIVDRRPFRSPHHTISDVGLVGGGHDLHPGEISLAHNGVLFLDEFPEFKRHVLEVLRQPLETGSITISRASGSCRFPARFILCAAMNPCPCGRGEIELGCTCKIEEKRRYLRKISGPLLDRIDLRVDVRQLTQNELLSPPDGETSAVIRDRVATARALQQQRYHGTTVYCNGQLEARGLNQFCQVDKECELLLRQAVSRYRLSPRAYSRILKVARTIADLANSKNILEPHIFEAIAYRQSQLLAEN